MGWTANPAETHFPTMVDKENNDIVRVIVYHTLPKQENAERVLPDKRLESKSGSTIIGR